MLVMRAAFLGPSGTYAEQAALALLGQTVVSTPFGSIQATLRAAAAGEAECAVVPIENSIEGSVPATLDTLWLLPSLQVRTALVLPIRHCLISNESDPAQIKAVYSHPQALAQCQNWLEKHLLAADRLPTASTSEALRYVAPGTAAIASVQAAELHGLPILAHTINDHPDNCTRFWLVSAAPLGDRFREPATYTSIAFSLKANRPGVLYEALTIFALERINLARIESRPTKKVIGEYLFFADLEGANTDKPIARALARLAGIVAELRVFGSYGVVGVVKS